MKNYYRDIIHQRLKEIFDEQDTETVLTWLISNDGRRPVVVVGAGFSLNARNKRTGLPASRAEVPLWGDVLDRFAADLRLKSTRYDALTLAELHYEEIARPHPHPPHLRRRRHTPSRSHPPPRAITGTPPTSFQNPQP